MYGTCIIDMGAYQVKRTKTCYALTFEILKLILFCISVLHLMLLCTIWINIHGNENNIFMGRISRYVMSKITKTMLVF